MSAKNRPVDKAMNADRIEKQVMRSFWLEEVKTVAKNYPESEAPWYLTLPGADGLDIQLLIDEGIINMTEVNSIANEDQNKIVAVEKDDEAVLKLRKKYVGLTIREVHFQEIVAGDRPFAWPGKKDKKYCRSRIVNLDLNSPLKHKEVGGQIFFPILEWIKKLCLLHAYPSIINWTLLLTIHGEIVWPQRVLDFTQNFLKDNFSREPEFEEQCQKFLGEKLFNIISDTSIININEFDRTSQQKYLNIFVPKYISKLVHSDGWRVKTDRNLRYGGYTHTAPMVSWIMKFELDPETSALPDKLYKESLKSILFQIGLINQNGKISS